MERSLPSAISGEPAQEFRPTSAASQPWVCNRTFHLQQLFKQNFSSPTTFQSICRLDPTAVTDEVSHLPLEIAAVNKNIKAFDLLAPHYEDNIRKQIAQLFVWALTEKTPSEEFKLLFESVPLTEVNKKNSDLTTDFCHSVEQRGHHGFQPSADSCLPRRDNPPCVSA